MNDARKCIETKANVKFRVSRNRYLPTLLTGLELRRAIIIMMIMIMIIIMMIIIIITIIIIIIIIITIINCYFYAL